MATLGIPNLCGANPDLENVLGKINNIADEISANLTADASVAAAAVQGKLDEGLADLKKLVPELPSLPSTNLQSEITSLLALSPTSLTYAASLAKITSDFGDALTKKGLSLDTLLKDGLTKIAAGGDVCGLVPNMEIESGSSEVKEKAATSGLASTDPIGENPAVINTPAAAVDGANAAMVTRKDDVTNLSKGAVGKVEAEVGTVDRASGSLPPATKTKIKELDAEVTMGKAEKNLGTPQSVRQKNHTAAVSNLEAKSVTGADTGKNTSSTAEAATPKFESKKKLLNDLDKAYQKWRDDAGLNRGNALMKASRMGYPHNLVPGTNKTKMYVWIPSGVPYKDLPAEYQKKSRVTVHDWHGKETGTGSTMTVSLNFKDALTNISMYSKNRKEAYNRLKDLVEQITPSTSADFTQKMTVDVAKFVQDCEKRAPTVKGYVDHLITFMIKPVKVPEQETKTEVTPIPTSSSDLAERKARYDANRQREAELLKDDD